MIPWHAIELTDLAFDVGGVALWVRRRLSARKPDGLPTASLAAAGAMPIGVPSAQIRLWGGAG